MKIHGTAKGAALSNKEAGVAFGGGAASKTYPDSMGSDGNLDAASCISLDETDEKLGTGCIEGDGSCNCSQTDDNVLADTFSAYTIGGWLRPANEATQYCLVLTANDGNTNNFQAITTHAATTEIRFAWGDDAGTRGQVRSSTTYSTGSWIFCVAVYDGSLTGTDRMKLYINGTSEGTATATPDSSYEVDSKCFLFQQDGAQTGSRFDGMIDDCFFASRALSSSEISDLYNSGDGALVSTLEDTDGIRLYFNCDAITSDEIINNAIPVS